MTLSLIVAAAMSAATVADQPGEAVAASPPVATAEPAPSPPPPLVVPKGTLVRLMVTREVNSRDAQAGTRFKLRVDEDVKVDGVTIIPVGATAWAEVVAASGTGSAGKSGRLNARLLYVEAMGQQVPLDGERDAKGGSSTGQVVAGILSFGIGGLLMKGNNASLRAGEIFNGYTLADANFARPGAGNAQ